MSRVYHAPPGHEPSVKTLPYFIERAKRDRWGAELDALMEIRNRHGDRAIQRHLSRLRAILARYAGDTNVRAA